MTVRVSSTHAAGSPPSGAEGHGGAPDGEPVAVLEPLARDALAVDERAVGRAEVADADVTRCGPSLVTRISLWRREMPGSSRTTSAVSSRPRTVMAPSSG